MAEWRYIVQRASTLEFLTWDLPLNRDELTWDLSGPGSLRGTISPVIGTARADDGKPILDEWASFIYAEADGIIRWGGIVIRSEFTGATWAVEAAGFSTYPHGMPYTGPSVSRVNDDPARMFEAFWTHLQTQPDGDLGVTVKRPNIPIFLGSKAEPYQVNWWEAPDCGSEMDTLAAETPFDYIETHRWSGSTNTILHQVEVFFPRAGRMRDDLTFTQGTNINIVPTYVRDGDGFAQEIHVLGKGEGAKTVRTSHAVRDGRLRRVAVYTDKMISTTNRARAAALREFNRRKLVPATQTVEVTNHIDAPIGSWSLGDDILIKGEVPWLGYQEIWHRVVGWSMLGDHKATLALVRSDMFEYKQYTVDFGA